MSALTESKKKAFAKLPEKRILQGNNEGLP